MNRSMETSCQRVELQFMYTFAELAQLGRTTRGKPRRLLERCGVTFLRSGQMMLIPLGEGNGDPCSDSGEAPGDSLARARIRVDREALEIVSRAAATRAPGATVRPKSRSMRVWTHHELARPSHAVAVRRPACCLQ